MCVWQNLVVQESDGILKPKVFERYHHNVCLYILILISHYDHLVALQLPFLDLLADVN